MTVAAPAATVIAGVSLATNGRRHNGDRFDLAISPERIEIRRPGQEIRQLPWDAVSEWEIEDQRGGVLLTLRGRGAVTPLHVPRWTVDDLAAVLQEATGAQAGPAAPAAAEAAEAAAAAAPATEASAPAAPSPVTPAPAPNAVAPAAPASTPATTPAPTPAEESVGPTAASEEAAAEPAGTRRRRRRQQRFDTWKVVAIVSLLAVLATAVTLVLLQSAGVINLSFLGPTA